jgi:hypothetical protein
MPRGVPNSTFVERTEPFEEQIVAPVAPEAPIIGDTGYKYYWSSQHRMGMLRGHKTVFPFTRPEWTDLPDDPRERQAARRQKAAFERDFTAQERATFDRALDYLGTNEIVWLYAQGPLSGTNATTGFVYYGTDNDDVAFVIENDLKNGGDAQYIRAIPQDTYLNVGGVKYANTDLARIMALNQSIESGQPLVPEKKAS